MQPVKRDREFLLYFCRVMLREARARRHQPTFVAFLLNGAARARREAMELPKANQSDLFVGAA